MNLAADKARLMAITKDLFMKWEQAKETWKDSKSLEFERKYMFELMAGVDGAVAVIEQLDKLIAKVRRDCE
jgi:hypothetical protein